MMIRRIVPNISSNNLEGSKKFYSDFLGLKLAMDMDWILTFVSNTNPTVQITILKSNEVELNNSNVAVTVEVSDIDKIYNKTTFSKYEITYPLTVEPWGVRSFFVKDPNGVTINIMCHILNS